MSVFLLTVVARREQSGMKAREKQKKRRKGCVDGLSGKGRQVEVSVEWWGV